jgi:RNase P subunit RPR2
VSKIKHVVTLKLNVAKIFCSTCDVLLLIGGKRTIREMNMAARRATISKPTTILQPNSMRTVPFFLPLDGSITE